MDQKEITPNLESKSNRKKRTRPEESTATRVANGTGKRTWEDSFQALRAYKEEHGHCLVPSKYKEDPALGRWVEKTRRKIIPNVTEAQLDRLTKLGFDWETLEERIDREWMEKFKLLNEFRAAHGNCRVPAGKKKHKDDPQMLHWIETLGGWVARQRDFAKKGRLREDRKKKLMEIGFEFTSRKRKTAVPTEKRDTAWHSNYVELQAFRTKYGHTMVTMSAQKSLYIWVKNQRELYRRQLLRPERKELLDQLSFVWKSDDSNPEASHHQRLWDEMLAQLQAFYNTHGHVRVPPRKPYLVLHNWLDHQKTYMRRDKLLPGRLARLKALGVQV